MNGYGSTVKYQQRALWRGAHSTPPRHVLRSYALARWAALVVLDGSTLGVMKEEGGQRVGAFLLLKNIQIDLNGVYFFSELICFGLERFLLSF